MKDMTYKTLECYKKANMRSLMKSSKNIEFKAIETACTLDVRNSNRNVVKVHSQYFNLYSKVGKR
jgi:uncharacterized metal-binding protein